MIWEEIQEGTPIREDIASDEISIRTRKGLDSLLD
jgi:hypothetical protein